MENIPAGIDKFIHNNPFNYFINGTKILLIHVFENRQMKEKPVG